MSYELLPILSAQSSLQCPNLSLEEISPSIGYHFFLSPNGKTGHHILFHKTGYFIAAVRQYDAFNLNLALTYHGGASGFHKIIDQPTEAAKQAFQIALRTNTRHILIQAVVTDIATNAKSEDTLGYIIRFIKKANLNVSATLTPSGLRITDGAKTYVEVFNQHSLDLTKLTA